MPTNYRKLIQKIIEEQWYLNDKTLENWRTKLNEKNWEQAILVETGEALESTAYKWWKKQNIDVENIKVELIDILHFAASLIFYYPKKYDEFIDLFVLGNTYSEKYPGKKIINNGIIEEKNGAILRESLLLIGQNKSIEVLAYELGKAFSLIDMNIEDIFRNYFVKNTLNEFRQIKGYKKGEYKKIWNYKNDKVEDNVVAFDIAKNIINLENFKEELLNKLEEIYNKQ